MIEVLDLYIRYPGNDTFAVDRISFSVKQGQFYSLVGPSGCGKTTTLRSIAGLEQPEGGEIIIGNDTVYSEVNRINLPSYKREIGMVFQSYAIWPHMSVFDNVAFPLTTTKTGKTEINHRVRTALETVGLIDLSKRDATMLSGGQQQRLALARALVSEPKVLLLDEPLSNLDAKLRQQMRIEIRSLQQRLGITTLYVTHDQEEALSMSDMIAILNHGHVMQIGAPEDIYYRPANEFVARFIGSINLLKGKWQDGILIFPWGKLQMDSSFAPAGDWLSIGIRPEDIEINSRHAENDQHVFTGQVTSIMFLGHYYECYVRLSDDCSLRVYVRQSQDVRVGDKIKVFLKKEAIYPIPSSHPEEAVSG